MLQCVVMGVAVLDEVVVAAVMAEETMVVVIKEDAATQGHMTSANSVANLATSCSAAGSTLTGTSPVKKRWQTWRLCHMVLIQIGTQARALRTTSLVNLISSP
jgi:hypothetical protein